MLGRFVTIYTLVIPWITAFFVHLGVLPIIIGIMFHCSVIFHHGHCCRTFPSSTPPRIWALCIRPKWFAVSVQRYPSSDTLAHLPMLWRNLMSSSLGRCGIYDPLTCLDMASFL